MAEVIKEFLVKLGFQLDDTSFSKYREGMSRVAQSTLEVGAKAAGAAAAVAAMVDKISDQYESLYFSSIRANTSVASLAQFSYGARAIGLTSEQATGTLERFNLTMMANPANTYLLNALGVQTVGKNTKEIFNDLIKTLAKMSPWMQFKWGQLFGLSPEEINLRVQMRDKETRAEEDYAERLKESGINMDDLATKSNAFQQGIRGLWTENELLLAQVADKWLPNMTSAVTWTDSWLRAAVAADRETKGWISTLGAFIEVLVTLKGFEWLLRWLGLGGAAAGFSFGSGALIGGALLGGAAVGAGAAGAAVERKFGNKELGMTPGLEGLPQMPVPGQEPASVRYGNPGAQYPNERAKLYGMQGYGVIGGGHLIAKFPTPEAGAASNMDLYAHKYVGMTVGAAGAKWTGGSSFSVPGYDPRTVVTEEMMRDPKFVIPFMKAIAARESGYSGTLTNEQWQKAYEMYMQKNTVFGDSKLGAAEDNTRASPDMETRSEVKIQQNNTVIMNHVLDPQGAITTFEKSFGKWNDQLARQVH